MADLNATQVVSGALLYVDRGDGFRSAAPVQADAAEAGPRVEFTLAGLEGAKAFELRIPCAPPCVFEGAAASCGTESLELLSCEAAYSAGDADVFVSSPAVYRFAASSAAEEKLVFSAKSRPFSPGIGDAALVREMAAQLGVLRVYAATLQEYGLKIKTSDTFEKEARTRQKYLDGLTRAVRGLDEDKQYLAELNRSLEQRLETVDHSRVYKVARFLNGILSGLHAAVMALYHLPRTIFHLIAGAPDVPEPEAVGPASPTGPAREVCNPDALEPYDCTVSVIIPTHNAGDAFSTLLYALRRQKGLRGLELVVADAASTDRTQEIARFFGAKTVALPDVASLDADARNRGADAATGDILLFMDQDALPADDAWVYAMVTPIVKGDAAAASCTEWPRNEGDLTYHIDNWALYQSMAAGKGNVFLETPKDTAGLHISSQLSGVACAVRADLFRQYRYRGSYAEDLSLGIRLQLDGHKIAFLHNVRVIHGHDRDCAYYLKRSYLSRFALRDILPDFKPERMKFDDAVSLIWNGYIEVMTYIQALREADPGLCSVNDYMRLLRACAEKAQHATGKAVFGQSYSTPFVDGFLEKVDALTRGVRLSRRSLFPYVHQYMRDSVGGYLRERFILVPEGFRLEMEAVIFKRFVIHAGLTVADYAMTHADAPDGLTGLCSIFDKEE